MDYTCNRAFYGKTSLLPSIYDENLAFVFNIPAKVKVSRYKYIVFMKNIDISINFNYAVKQQLIKFVSFHAARLNKWNTLIFGNKVTRPY